MDYKSKYYPESKFGGFTDVDGTVTFYLRVNSLINPASVILDIGCGRGTSYTEDPVPIRRSLRIFKGRVGKVIGVDIDEQAKENPFLDEFYLIEEGGRWPLVGESVDVCVCDFTLEHVADTEMFFSECRRVIKPGGYLCIRTTNILSYLGLSSKLVPNKLHPFVLSKAQAERKKEDIFPTLYRCNTTKKVRHILNKYGFDNCTYGYEAEPSYLSFSRFFYFLGVLYQRFAPSRMKSVILTFAKKE